MGRGGVSLGKTIKGIGLQGDDLDQAVESIDTQINSENDHEDPVRRLWSEFIEMTRDLHEQQRQRLEQMMSQRSGFASRIRLLVKEMKESSRAEWLRRAGEKIVEMRAMITRWSDTEAASLADLDTFLDLFRHHHDQVDIQIGHIRHLFVRHVNELSRDLTQVRDDMTQALNRDLEQIAIGLQTFLAQDRASSMAAQAQARDTAAVAESEYLQARESTKDQEQLTTLRLHLASQMDAYEAEFAARHAEYASVNGERQVELQAMMERDRALASVIARNDLRQNRLRQCSEVARTQLQSHRAEARTRNQSLHDEIIIMLGHVNELRRALKDRRQRRAGTAAEISRIASRVRTQLQKQLRQAERILRLHQIVQTRGGPGLDRKHACRLDLAALRQERDRQQTIQIRLRTQLNSMIGPGAAVSGIQHVLRINGH